MKTRNENVMAMKSTAISTKRLGAWTATVIDEHTVEARMACNNDGYDDYDRNALQGEINDAFHTRSWYWSKPCFSVDEERNEIVERFELVYDEDEFSDYPEAY